MKKASMELAKVNASMKIKFCIIMDAEDVKNKFHSKAVSKFNYDGNEYFRVCGNPFVTIDITSSLDKKEEWSTNRIVNLNRYGLYSLAFTLDAFIADFKKYKDLFYYNDRKELILNTEVKDRITRVLPLGSKRIQIFPCVVEDGSVSYEGCCFCINTLSNFCYLTYDEMVYFADTLHHIDMSNLELQLMNLYINYTREESKEVETVSKPVEATEDESEIDVNDTKVYHKLIPEKTIPDI